MHQTKRGLLFIALALTLSGRANLAADWPQFRGPRGDGHAESRDLPTSWGGFLEPPAWQTDIPGTGWSSPVVVGRRVWLTAAQTTALEAYQRAKKLAANPFSDVEPFQAHAAVSLMAVELDLDSGRILRRVQLFTARDPTPIHSANSYASPTPVTDGRRLYCHFGSLGTAAIALDSGKVLWKKQFVVDDITGPGSSPVLCGDLLLLARDGADEQYLVALHKATGEEAWRTERPRLEAAGHLKRAFCTPLVIQDGELAQVVAPAAHWALSYDPATGEELWRARIGPGHALVPRPVYRQGVVYVCSGFMRPELVAIRTDGAGDVSDTHVLWRYGRQVPEISSPLIVGDQIFFVSSGGIATCLDARDGQMIWQQRLNGSYSASPLAADGKIYFTSEQGVTTVLEPGREYRELARNRLFGQTMASLAVGGDSLLIRTAPSLYCVRKSR